MKKLVVVGLAFTSTDTGFIIRCLSPATIYFIETPVVTTLGYQLVDDAFILVEGVGNFINSITVSGTGLTCFTGDRIGGDTFRNVNIFSSGSGNTFVNITGRASGGPSRWIMNGGGIINFENLGTIEGCSFNPQSYAFFNFLPNLL